MTQVLMLDSREQIPAVCRKAGETLGTHYPAGTFAEYLRSQEKIWTLTESLYDETGARRGSITSYYVEESD